MHKSIIIGLLMVVIVVTLPAGFGYLATSRYHRLVNAINESGQVKLELIKQDRGWLASDILLRVSLSPHNQQSLEKYTKHSGEFKAIFVRSTLYHGPFPVSGEMVTFSPMVAHVVHQWIDAPESNRPVNLFDYTLTTDLNFDGSQQIKAAIHSLDEPLVMDEMKIDWRQITATIDLNLDDNKLELAAKIPFLLLSTAKDYLLIESLRVDSEFKKGTEGLAVGSSLLSLDRFLVRDRSTEMDFFIKDVHMQSESSLHQSMMDVHTHIDMSTLGIADEYFGKGEFDLDFRNLDAGVLARLSNKYHEFSQQDPIPEQQAKILMGSILLMEAANFLQTGPELELKVLQLDGDQENMEGYAKIAVDNSQPLLLTNPTLLQEIIRAKVRLVIPESLLISYHTALLRAEHVRAKLIIATPKLRELAMARVKTLLMPFVSTNMLRYADHEYQLNASLEQGNLLINGKSLNILPGSEFTQ